MISLSLRVGENTGDWAIGDTTRKFKYKSPTLYREVAPLEGMEFSGRDFPLVIPLPKPVVISKVRFVSEMEGRSCW